MENNITQTQPPFSILYANWDESQQQQYDLKEKAFTALVIAFVTVLTQYVVSEWIWSSWTKSKSKLHSTPVFLVSGIIMMILWSFILNDAIGLYNNPFLPIGFRIATPLLVAGGVPLNLLFGYLWTIIFKVDTRSNEEEEEIRTETDETPTFNIREEDLEQGEQENSNSVLNTAAAKPRTNINYITNIKIFLTCLVIIEHAAWKLPAMAYPLETYVTELLANGNWGFLTLYFFCIYTSGFFMHLFFFCSGFFTPRSLDKKGTYTFLFERVKRLGIPLIVCGYFVYPYTDDGNYMVQGYNPLSTPIFAAGVAWFLLQLIVFNIAYTCICGVGWSPKISCPSNWWLLAINIVLGLAAGITTLFFPGIGHFTFTVPNFWQSYWGYIAFFFGGALAQRNNWMDAIMKKSRLGIYLWAIIVSAAMIYSFLIWIPVYDSSVSLTFLYSFMFSMQCIPIGLAITVFFMDFVNKKYFFTDFFAKSMYTAYIIQLAFPIPAAVKLWQLVLSNMTNGGIEPVWVMVGWLFTSFFGLIFTWTIAYMIRSIPGFSKVL